MPLPDNPQNLGAVKAAEFICLECNEPWHVPPHVNCPRCGPGTLATPPEHLWDLSHVKGTNVFISAFPRNEGEVLRWRDEHGVRAIIDLANDPAHKIVWRPYKATDSINSAEFRNRAWYAERGIFWAPVWGIKDSADGHAFPSEKLDHFKDLMDLVHDRAPNVVVHCAAGLRRAPHFVHAWMRATGRAGGKYSWFEHILPSREYAVWNDRYMRSIDHWLASRSYPRELVHLD